MFTNDVNHWGLSYGLGDKLNGWQYVTPAVIACKGSLCALIYCTGLAPLHPPIDPIDHGSTACFARECAYMSIRMHTCVPCKCARARVCVCVLFSVFWINSFICMWGGGNSKGKYYIMGGIISISHTHTHTTRIMTETILRVCRHVNLYILVYIDENKGSLVI